MSLQKNLSIYLNAIRHHKKQSITEFSEETGIARSTLQELLSGNGNPRMDTVDLIADQLGVDPMEMLSAPQKPAQVEFALLLLKNLEAFSKMPADKRKDAATLFHQLMLLLKDEQ